jgi:two-component system, cell cycle sensor histidine kinase and response regulator CckA
MAGVTAPSTIHRSDRHQGLGLMLVIVGLLIGGLLSVLFVSHGQASPFIGVMLSFLSAAGVFFLFAYAFRLMHFGLAPAANDLTQAIPIPRPMGF